MLSGENNIFVQVLLPLSPPPNKSINHVLIETVPSHISTGQPVYRLQGALFVNFTPVVQTFFLKT